MQKKEQKTHLEAGADKHERTYDAFSGYLYKGLKKPISLQV